MNCSEKMIFFSFKVREGGRRVKGEGQKAKGKGKERNESKNGGGPKGTLP